MSEKYTEFPLTRPQRPPESLISVDQAAANILIYNAISRVSKGESIRQPSPETGPQTLELIPPQVKYNTLGLIIHPSWSEPQPVEPEPTITVQLCAELPDISLGFVDEYAFHFYEGRYWASYTPYVLDLAHANYDPMNGPRAIEKDDFRILNSLVAISPIKPIDD